MLKPKIINIIFSSNDEVLKTTYTQWLETKENLNQAFQLSKEELIADKINIDSLKTRSDELERNLSQKSAAFAQSNDDKQVSFQTLQKQLNVGEYAIEVVEVNEYKNGLTGEASYVALILTPTEIKFVPIGDAKKIEAAISDFREKTINIKPENEAYATTWQEVDAQLKGVSKLFISLDWAYHQLSINALKDLNGAYLVDKYNILFVGNSKD